MKNIFVYGDSISMQWGWEFEELCRNKYNYTRLGGNNSYDLANSLYNGQSTNEMLKWIEKYDCRNYDVLLFNCGLHDSKVEINNGEALVPLQKYRKNLEKICEIAKLKFEKVVGITTTPVNDNRHNSINTEFHRFNNYVVEYNKVFRGVIENANLSIIDLYKYTYDLSKMYDTIYIDHVHMKKEVSVAQARFIMKKLEETKI